VLRRWGDLGTILRQLQEKIKLPFQRGEKRRGFVPTRDVCLPGGVVRITGGVGRLAVPLPSHTTMALEFGGGREKLPRMTQPQLNTQQTAALTRFRAVNHIEESIRGGVSVAEALREAAYAPGRTEADAATRFGAWKTGSTHIARAAFPLCRVRNGLTRDPSVRWMTPRGPG